MKQVIAKAGKIVVVDVPVPTCKENEVLVKSAYSVISTGTETWTVDATEPISVTGLAGDFEKLKKANRLVRQTWQLEGIFGVLDWAKMARNPQVPLGYSLSGVVTQVGRKITDISVGDRVACAGEGKACHAEIASVPRNLLVKIPEGVELEDASFSTLGAIAMHGFRMSEAQIGDAVAVIGAGLVGNLMVQICRAAGCRVATVDLKQERLNLASEVGAHLVMSPSDEHLDKHLMHFTNGRGADGVIICASTDSNEPVNLASRIARDRARITVVGRVGMDFERKLYYQKELSVVMSRSLGPGRYDLIYEEQGVDYPIGYVRWTLNRNMEAFLDLVKQGLVRTRELVGGAYPVEMASEAFASISSQPKVAVLLKYAPIDHPAPHLSSCKIEQRVVSGRINTAVIGPGNFAKETVMPLLRRNQEFNLKWVVASNPVHARQVAERYRFEKCGSDFEAVLQDKETQLVVITTPNNLHYPMVIAAAKAGKTIFVEKPLCINEPELSEIIKVQEETKVPIFVGFNRRYSPLIRTVKEMLEHSDGPFLLTYRVNADFIPMSRWIQDPDVGGGRIIAEGCHFFDLFNFLLHSSTPEVFVANVGVNGSTTVTKDNIIATLRYRDGSVASLVYAALGNRTMDRERLEVFGQGVAMVLDDYRHLQIYGDKKKVVTLNRPDKGHGAQFRELAKYMHGTKSSMIPFEQSIDSMRLTFEVDGRLRRIQG